MEEAFKFTLYTLLRPNLIIYLDAPVDVVRKLCGQPQYVRRQSDSVSPCLLTDPEEGQGTGERVGQGLACMDQHLLPERLLQHHEEGLPEESTVRK